MLISLLLKSTAVLVACLAVNQLPRVSAGAKHLFMVVGVICLPLTLMPDLFPDSWVAQEATLSLPVIDIDVTALPVTLTRTDNVATSVQQPTGTWIEFAVVLFALVCLLKLSAWAYRLWQTRRLLAPATSSRALACSEPGVRVYASAIVHSPLTWGIRQPTILLPETWHTWSRDELQAVLAHERAHIQRCDTLVHVLLEFMRCFYWWHPLFRVVQKQIQLQAEVACDDIVVSQTAKPMQYAALLLRLARVEQAGSVVAMAASGSLPTRIKALVNQPHRRSMMTSFARTRWIALSLLTVLATTVLRPAQGSETEGVFASDGDMLPIVKVAPIYPADARQQGIEGYVVLQFTVAENGRATGATVVESVPEGVFDSAALDALKHYKYKPAVEQGKPVATSGVRNRVTFKLSGGSSVETVPAALPEDLLTVLGQAHDALTDKNYARAGAILDYLALDQNLQVHERAQVDNLAGYLAYSQGDYATALVAYRQVIIHPDQIPEGLYGTTLYTLAQLSFVVEAYDDALMYMQQWQDQADQPGPIPLIFMSQVNYQMQRYPESIDLMEEGLSEARTRDVEIRENWLQLLAYLYYEEARWSDTLNTLQQLNERFPKPEYEARIDAVRQQLDSTPPAAT